MSSATKTPPIRLSRRGELASKAVPTPRPRRPTSVLPTPPKPAPQTGMVNMTIPAQIEKPKGPACTRPEPRPPLCRVDHPRRLRRGSKEHRHLGGFNVAGPEWGSPFRTREIDGTWTVIWTGAIQGLGQYQPAGWADIPCASRLEAAQQAQEAFRDWITAPASAGLLEHARRVLRGYHLVCSCQEGYKCHADVLVELVNRPALRGWSCSSPREETL